MGTRSGACFNSYAPEFMLNTYKLYYIFRVVNCIAFGNFLYQYFYIDNIPLVECRFSIMNVTSRIHPYNKKTTRLISGAQ